VKRGHGGGSALRTGTIVVAMVGSLVAVAWRQPRALDALADLESVRREHEILTAEQVELERRIQRLESRSRVVPEARRRLGMRMPDAREIMILPGAEP